MQTLEASQGQSRLEIIDVWAGENFRGLADVRVVISIEKKTKWLQMAATCGIRMEHDAERITETQGKNDYKIMNRRSQRAYEEK